MALSSFEEPVLPFLLNILTSLVSVSSVDHAGTDMSTPSIGIFISAILKVCNFVLYKYLLYGKPT